MYINEATNELVKKNETRNGKIKVEKHISDSQICQDGKVSTDKIVIPSDDLATSTSVQLNYIGDQEDIEGIGALLVNAPFGAC